ncbi:DUF418 domain-containing protein [Catalinimonas sp. 4WD22]|uniref:DUF418 domain-containing protein n=1 Tax=Catalinimonas locisalis TaxID=3133978 RepID=UPI003100E837
MNNAMGAEPIPKKTRIEVLDVFRGFAVFGIFIINIEIMNCTFINQGTFSQQWSSGIDQLTSRILQLFFYTKFFPIFSLLFGLGIAMQALKLQEHNKLSFSFFGRRMFVLFIFGLLHITLLWSGDVLHLYAMLGMLTTLLIKRSKRWILILSAIVLFFPFYEQLFDWFVQLTGFQPESYLQGFGGAETVRIIRSGSYTEGIGLRLREYAANIPLLFMFLAPIAFAMFLLGLYLGKINVLGALDGFILSIRKPMLVLAVFTNLYRIVFLFFLPDFKIYRSESLRPFFFKMMEISDMFMGLFYLWLIGWLWYFTSAKKLLSPLKYVGRMALTNYIMHSVMGVFLFSSLGLQLYETLSPSQTLFTAIMVFALQLIYSRLWLNHFQYGPLEWLWRCFTYQKRLPIRKVKRVPPKTAK